MPPQTMTSPTPQPVAPIKTGKFQASFTLVKESWGILKKDQEIMWFPVLSAVVSTIATVVLIAVFYLAMGVNLSTVTQGDQGIMNASSYVTLFIYYVVTFFIISFFQAGIYIIAHARFNGQDLTFKDGINGALKNSGKIFAWAVISATVGVILRIIADRFKTVGKIISAILGAAWNILTYFSLPSLVIGQTSIKQSFQESASLIRKTWGEAIIINFGVGFFFGILSFLGFVIAFGLMIVFQTLSAIIISLLLLVVYEVALAIISSSLNSIFKLALYEYARTGSVPQGFTPELIKNAVQAK